MIVIILLKNNECICKDNEYNFKDDGCDCKNNEWNCKDDKNN